MIWQKIPSSFTSINIKLFYHKNTVFSDNFTNLLEKFTLIGNNFLDRKINCYLFLFKIVRIPGHLSLKKFIFLYTIRPDIGRRWNIMRPSQAHSKKIGNLWKVTFWFEQVVPKKRWTYVSENEEAIILEPEIELDQKEISKFYKNLKMTKNNIRKRS